MDCMINLQHSLTFLTQSKSGFNYRQNQLSKRKIPNADLITHTIDQNVWLDAQIIRISAQNHTIIPQKKIVSCQSVHGEKLYDIKCVASCRLIKKNSHFSQYLQQLSVILSSARSIRLFCIFANKLLPNVAPRSGGGGGN